MKFQGKLLMTRAGTVPVITTLNRVDTQITVQNLPEYWRKRLVIACPEEEVELHRRNPAMKGVSYLNFEHKNMGQVRQVVVDFLKEEKKVHKYFLLDDDMYFYTRKSATEWPLRYAEKNEVGGMLDMLEHWLQHGHAHVGISVRQGNNFETRPAAYIGRMFGFHGHNLDILRLIPEVRWGDFVTLDDFNICLDLLVRGYPNLMTWHYAWGQKSSNSPGGCSSWRNLKNQEEAAHQLAKKFPRFVKTVVKANKSGWEGMENRTDVRIQWAQAFKSSGQVIPDLPARVYG
jgi:hypothetical protein